MTLKKLGKLVATNSSIAATNIVVFSKAFLGLSLFTGTAFTMSVAWFSVVASLFSFYYVNNKILAQYDTYSLIANKVHSLDDCVEVFEEAIENGDVFDNDIIKNLSQLKRFKRKRSTIREILLQKFSEQELTYQKFDGILQEVENVLYLNMRSILNKIAAFDVEEYENHMKKGDTIPQEKMEIYNEYISFVKQATKTNEEILLKLDKVLLEVSKYNSIDSFDINKFSAITEIDELIKNAKLYK